MNDSTTGSIGTSAAARRARTIELGTEMLAWYKDSYLSPLGFDVSAAKLTECVDPSTGAKLWDLPNFSSADINAAVERASAAQRKWEQTPPQVKSEHLMACANAFASIEGSLADLVALETGKSLTYEARSETKLASAIFRYFAGLCTEVKGRSIQADTKLFGFTTHHPWGVVAGIVPWNMPLMFMAYKIAAPLAVGNSVVIKMPEQASVTLMFVLRKIIDLLPKGTIEFVAGEGDGTGNSLVNHPKVDKVSFTGSVDSGRHVYRQVADRLRPVTLELGGKSAMVILEDCDITKAVDGVFNSTRFTRAGQSCTSATRIYVPSSRMQEYREALSAKLSGLMLGDALDEQTQCGPVVSKKQQKRVEAYLEQASADNLDIEVYGDYLPGTERDLSCFVQPHLIFNPPHDHIVSQEEIFGPVATVTGYDSVQQAIDLSNATAYGLSASVWGRDINECLNIAQGFRAGIVQINQNAIMLPGFSYGGVGVSGIGKESSLEAMLGTYTYEKTNIVNFG